MKQKILFREALWVLLAICISFISIYLIFQLSDPDNLLFSADGFVIQNKNIFYYSIGWTLLAAVFIPVLFFLTILRQLFTKFRNKKQNIYFIVIAVFNLAHTIFLIVLRMKSTAVKSYTRHLVPWEIMTRRMLLLKHPTRIR